MSKAVLLALADRCERETPHWRLDVDIELAITPDAIDRYWDGLVRVGLGDKAYNPPNYTAFVHAAKSLEPADAQEVCIRIYRKGAYVRITVADGTPVYCEVLDRPITEAMARCAAALRARAALLDEGADK
jgi:hypothetical protein